jgi:hypothetical protein
MTCNPESSSELECKGDSFRRKEPYRPLALVSLLLGKMSVVLLDSRHCP